MLWNQWLNLVCELRSACACNRNFLWLALCLAGMTIRMDLCGGTSIVRSLELEPAGYNRLLDFFRSPALDLDMLTLAWCALVFRLYPGIIPVNGRPILVGDGIKVAKSGRKMPAVKKPHKSPSETPSLSTSSATLAKRSPCWDKLYPVDSPYLWPVRLSD